MPCWSDKVSMATGVINKNIFRILDAPITVGAVFIDMGILKRN